MQNLNTWESSDKTQVRLRELSKNEHIIQEMQHCLSSWDYKSTYVIADFKEDIEQVTQELIAINFPNNDNENLFFLVKNLVLSEVYDTVFFRIKENLAQHDLAIYKMSQEFCKTNGTPKQLGTTFYNFVPNAAVVELSMMSNKRTPLDKLKCLRIAYDYIFAEVKGALISVISKYSEKEIDLPLINNNEVFPIVMAVILKSKLFYFVSEMTFVKEFGSEILREDGDLRQIYMVFDESLRKIQQLSIGGQKNYSDKLNRMSVCGTIDFIENLDKEKTSSQTIFYEERRRVAQLITCATTEDLENYK